MKKLDISIDDFIPIDHLDDADYCRFMELRGGCSCHTSPPCSACVEPITYDELEMLDIELKPVMVEDIMAITRSFCQ